MTAKPYGLAVKALVSDDQGRILLIRRSPASKWFRHQWDLPGGKVDAGESFDAALLREVAEETRLTVSIEGVAGASQYDMPHIRVALLFLEARSASGELQLSDEHDAFQWTAREEILALDLSDQLRGFLLDYCRR
jgi:8-oxo-dGTP diphosphatase